MEFESAMTGVSKTTDMCDAELAAMGEEIKKLTTEIPITLQQNLRGSLKLPGNWYCLR
jgi:hypothetical protein